MSEIVSLSRHTNRILVCCGARTGNSPDFMAQADALGDGLGRAGYTIVYGGGNGGLMGAVCRAATVHGATIHGYGLDAFLKMDGLLPGVTLERVADLFIRKEKFLLSCDAGIILPGGIGTLDELAEIAAANDLQCYVDGDVPLKPIIVVNYQGFYDHLFKQLETSIKHGFVHENQMRMFHLVPDAAAAMTLLDDYNKAPATLAATLAKGT
ncbi:MAG: TIGR00730 family Rossman fold protein [Pseudomonadota bacterium]